MENMVAVFRGVRRVLRRDGLLFLNLGDCYANKQRQMMPARVALALQADGWWLRSEIVWFKKNPMPASVTDRPTDAHEMVYMLSRSPRYFFDQEAVREPAEWARWGDQTNVKHEGSGSAAWWITSRSKSELQRPQARRAMELFEQAGLTEEHARAIRAVGISDTGKATVTQSGTGKSDPALIALAQEAKDALGGYYREFLVPNGRNVRSVWDIATQPYAEAHFATYPEELVRRCILAGTSERGCCPVCGAPWEREVERTKFDQASISTKRQLDGALRHDGDRNLGGQQFNKFKRENPDRFIGWRPTCGCVTDPLGDPAVLRAPVPCVVLDPFMGSGTTAHVARKHGRRSIGIELNPAYCKLIERRTSQQSLLAEDVA